MQRWILLGQLLPDSLGGAASVLTARLLEWFGLDDVVGAVSVHAIGGSWGTLAAGLFKRGDLFNPDVVWVQMIGVGAAFLWAFPTTLVCYWVINKVMGARASSLEEQRGLDYSEHYEIGYPEFQSEQLFKGKE